MKRIFNAKTAIAACLVVTIVTLSSFTRNGNPALLGSSQSASLQLADGPQSAAAGLPTTYIVPTVYVVPYTRLITVTRYITQTDLEVATSTIIPIQPGQGVLSPAQKLQRKMSSLD
ncbi:hypothetical protein F0L74_10830 [Chitinophaga agrisoli]|uniref:Uncharacterized protein n=1 Tax=Chitinophaga agrisoli TaxID=2607653 RepID=A0A5B2VXN2_9BACT|nr:hypothetical protein [Chitinophaga agrisoli]KAA2243007.1 hypothetical protein F0L74_10830 [Chitinophaga agrisoli]